MTIQTDTINRNFELLAAALSYAADRGSDFHKAAALLVTRCEDMLNGDYVAPKTITAKILSAIEPNSPMDTLVCRSVNEATSDEWLFRLQQFVNVAADISIQQQAAALVLVLQNNVRRESDTTFVVEGSRPYLVTLQNGVDLADGFECRCKGFWSHGGGNVCKHIAAALMIALDPVDLFMTL